MVMKKNRLVLLTVMVLVACGNSTSETEREFEDLREKVLNEHDAIMNEMSKIGTLQQKLQPKIDSTENNSDYKQAAQNLDEVDKSMFTWMHQFDEKFPDISDKDKEYSDDELEDKIEELKTQKKKLDEIKHNFERHLKEAEHVLEEE